ncbi:MAG: transposase [Lachnospiraceae bacterium]|nr:transposase [Lachnospiraceae bacterium]
MIDTLASIVGQKTGRRPYAPDTLYLFCGRRSDRIKGLV